MISNHGPCFIPSPPNGVDAFSLVRKVQGQPSGAGEASKAKERDCMNPVTIPQPASPTRQNGKICWVEGRDISSTIKSADTTCGRVDTSGPSKCQSFEGLNSRQAITESEWPVKKQRGVAFEVLPTSVKGMPPLAGAILTRENNG